ncbi:MAG: sulfite exporter TauE/SafE family protein [Methylobacteriaceae bacterium]|nr:sulfite exporter TauE/SafE family protein [Methylobacteriaceae bacterium]
MSLDASLAGSALAGLLSFLSPCVLPLVPAWLAFLTGAEGAFESDAAARRRAAGRAVAFVAGFSTVFVALGATATTLGRFVGQWYDWLAVAAGLAIIAMGLHFLGLLRIGLLYREARLEARKPVGLFGAYVVGLAFAFGWTPCAGPVLATILMIAGAQGETARGVALLAAYSLGIGLPFIASALFVGAFRRFFDRFKRRLGLVEKGMGVLLVATGVLIATGRMAEVANWLLETFPALGRIG